MIRKKKKTVLVTGAASGIGRACADRLCANGHTVISADKREPQGEVAYRFFKCDITDDESLRRVRDELRDGGIELDAMICVAGIHAMASLVECDTDIMKRLVDVNLLGTMRTVRCFHGLLKPNGRVIIVTSEVASYDPMPFNGLYNVTKTALECYAQALRQELNLIGQRVVTVLPGATETPLADSTTESTVKLTENTELYKDQAGKFLGIVNRFKGTPVKPEVIAAVIERAALVKRPRISYAKHRSPGLVLLSALPRGVQCSIIKLLLRTKRKGRG